MGGPYLRFSRAAMPSDLRLFLDVINKLGTGSHKLKIPAVKDKRWFRYDSSLRVAKTERERERLIKIQHSVLFFFYMRINMICRRNSPATMNGRMRWVIVDTLFAG